MTTYPPEEGPDYDDKMPRNVTELAETVVGHRIVTARQATVPEGTGTDNAYGPALELTLDNGRRVYLIDTEFCCAYTELREFLHHPERVDHVVTGVGATDRFTSWHIYADMGDVLELTVDWSPGNGHYGYGFTIAVVDAPAGGAS